MKYKFIKKLAFVSYSCVATLMLGCYTASVAETNEIPGVPSWYVLPRLVWGEAANGIRAGVTDGDPQINGILVLIARSEPTNWSYVAAPDARFSKVELIDTNGTVVIPLKGKQLDGNLPQQILMKDLPRLPDRGTKERGSTGGLRDWLPAESPAVLKVFSIRDVYGIKKEGDYTLTVWPVIYKYESDKPYVSRVDVPSVTTKIHFAPSK